MPLPQNVVGEQFPHESSRELVLSLEHSLQKEAILYNRRTSDKWFFPVVGFWWLWMLYTVCAVLTSNDPSRISHGYDYQGTLCSVDKPTLPYVYWSSFPDNPDKIDVYTPICVEKCPTFQDARDKNNILYPNRTVDVNVVNDQVNTSVSVNFVQVPVYGTRLFSRQYCFPTDSKKRKKILKTLHLNDSWMVFQRVFKSLQTAWPVLICAIFIVLVYSFAYIFLLPKLTLSYFWINNWIAPLAIMITCMYFVLSIITKSFNNSTSAAIILDWIPVWRWFFFSSLLGVVIAGYFLVATASTRKTAHQAVALSQTTLECAMTVPAVFILPAFGAMLYISIFFLGCVVVSSLISSPSTAPIPTVKSYGAKKLVYGIISQFSYSPQILWQSCLVILSCLWLTKIIQSLVEFCVSFIVSLWYFTVPDMCGTRYSVQYSIPGALWIALRHHCATLHIAGLVMSLSRMIQIVSGSAGTYIKNKHRWLRCCCCYNPAAYFCFNFLQSLVYRLESILQFMNVGGLIECSLNGKNYFNNCHVAYFLLHKDSTVTQNMAQIHLLNTWLNTYAIAVVLSGMVFWIVSTIPIFNNPYSNWFVDSPVGLAVITLFCTSAISHIFIMSFNHMSMTLLYCYLKEFQNEGVPAPLFAPDSLRALIEEAEAERRLSEIADVTFTHGQSLLSLAAQDATFIDRAINVTNSKRTSSQE